MDVKTPAPEPKPPKVPWYKRLGQGLGEAVGTWFAGRQ
jgi:hypothetical protein